MANPVRRVGLLTEGGDCPGLNAAIRAVVKTASTGHGIEVIAFMDGFRGLVEDTSRVLRFDDVANILTQGGTILGAPNRDRYFVLSEDRNVIHKDRTADALKTFKRHRLDALICTGGDGTMTVAHYLDRQGLPIIGIPKTIDNDVVLTDQSIGFDSAFTVATESIDRIHSTAASHHRILVVEVMGRKAGWIALHAGLAGGGDVILIPEIPHSVENVGRIVRARSDRGRRSSVVVLAEGAGRAMELAARIDETTKLECRAVILGYLQRGGTPTPFDRLLATEFGSAAVRCAAEGRFGRMISWQKGEFPDVALADVAGKSRSVTVEDPLVGVARGVGISFG